MIPEKNIIELMNEIIAEVKRSNWLLEKSLQKKGLLSRENETKVKEELINRGILKKRDVCEILGVSENSATDIMKRVTSESIVRIPGMGARSSLLVYVGNSDSLESKAIKLEKDMLRGSGLTREEIMNNFQLKDSKNEVDGIVSLMRSFFGKEFFWESGKLVRRK